MKPSIHSLILRAACVFMLANHVLHAQTASPTEPLGGQPAPGAKPSEPDLEEQVLYQRVFEAVVWSQPAVGVYGIRRGMAAVGATDNVVMAMSRPLTTRHEFLTANNTTPYIAANADLRNGAVVLEVPPASDKGVLYGQVVDAWQQSIADVGPIGADKGNGGKYLFLPPEFKEAIPKGYLPVRCHRYRIQFAFRSIRLPGMTDADANDYAKKLQMYPLAEAASPKPTRFVDGYPDRISTLPFYDFRYFEHLAAIVEVEPVRPRDKVMMGMLASLGIESGKPFAPSPKARKAMERAVVDAYFYTQNLVLQSQAKNLYWPDRHWSQFFLPDPNGGFTWDLPNGLFYDRRAVMYHPGTYYPEKLAEHPATYYLMPMADAQGQPLEAGKTYRLRVPKDIPVREFWALNIYDTATWAFIYNPLDRVGLSSYDRDELKFNDDGSVDIYFGPKAPAGWEANWIPTQGKRPMPILRLYGAEEPFWNKTFKMPDPELVK